MEIVHTKYLGLFQIYNRVGGLMVSVPASSEVDSGFEPWSGQTKDYDMCCFSTKHAAVMSKNNDWLAQNQNNVSE